MSTLNNATRKGIKDGKSGTYNNTYKAPNSRKAYDFGYRLGTKHPKEI